jgi:hypothetical protein
VRVFREAFAPLLDVLWVDETIHERALDEVPARETATRVETNLTELFTRPTKSPASTSIGVVNWN